MSNARNLANLLETDGDVITAALDNIAQTPAAISDQANTSTGQFDLPTGTTAQRPGTPLTGAQRFNSDLGVMEFYNGTIWLKIAATQALLTSVTGNILSGIAGANPLTLVGDGFLTSGLVVNFTQAADSINANVTVTPSSQTTATVVVPAAVYNNVSAGNVVSITVTNTDQTTSSVVNKTAAALPTGGTITTVGSDRVHTFTSSGTFVVPTNITLSNVDFLVLAGGGTGGGHNAGGGGAGGLRTSYGSTSGGGASAQSAISSMTTGNFTVTVGAGAAGYTTPADRAGSTGSGSSLSGTGISTISTSGGGGGCSTASNQQAQSGGCGGGGASSFTKGSGTSGEGYAGGQGNSGQDIGGGGGTAAAGQDGSENNYGGDGGAGTQVNIDGNNYYWGGGGGGAAYQSGDPSGDGGIGGGGGGAGGDNAAGGAGGGSAINSGTAGNSVSSSGNVGGGGGANSGGGSGGVSRPTSTVRGGGSGIVILRYTL